MTIYIPFLRAESAQLAGQAHHYRETITFKNDGALAAVKGALRVVAHGSKDGYLFHDSTVTRNHRITLSPGDLKLSLTKDGLTQSVVHIDLNCCELGFTDFPMTFSAIMPKVLITAYPFSLQGPGRAPVEVALKKPADDDHHRDARVFGRTVAQIKFMNGQRVDEA